MINDIKVWYSKNSLDLTGTQSQKQMCNNKIIYFGYHSYCFWDMYTVYVKQIGVAAFSWE